MWGGWWFLVHTKAVLLVNHNKAYVGKLHPILNQCVGANEDKYLTRQRAGQDITALFGFGRTRQHSHTPLDGGAGEHLGDGCVVLACEDFGGGHHTRLIAIVGSQ